MGDYYSFGSVQKGTNSYRLLIVLVLLSLMALDTRATTLFKAIPLAEDYFEKVYMVNHQSKEYYLIISCK